MRRTMLDLRARPIARGPFSLRASVVVAASIFGFYAGCSNNTETETADTTTTTVTGTGAMGPCYNNIADGVCIPDEEANSEPCECSDCTASAKCTGGCTDDGNCTQAELGNNPENTDCSCNDCFFKVPQCSPNTDGCVNNDDDGQCQANEACTCAECTNTPGCQACDGNGVCNNIFEGCSCNDCTQQCQSSGPGPTSSSSGMGGSVAGPGGMGGAINGAGGNGGGSGGN